jgi:sugar phosphate isomerase/epimerase
MMLNPYYGNEDEVFRLNLEFYRSLAPLAKKYGVKIGIENMWGFHSGAGLVIEDVFADPREHARIFDELADPEAFTLCLDIGHSAITKREPAYAIRTLGRERLGALHIHDLNYREDLHTLPGASKINWQSVCEALADIDYKGAYNLEADGFFRNFLPEHYSMVAKFMCDTSRVFADKIERLKAENKAK